MKSQLTTLCYIEQDGKYLMLHRTVKHNDENHNKWIGVGGHFEERESPEDCLVREVREETGLILESFSFRGIVTFISETENSGPTKNDTSVIQEYMCLYTSNKFSGKTPTALYPATTVMNEGELSWVQKSEVLKLNLWEGDKIFLNLLTKDVPFFSLKLVYKNGLLVSKQLNGIPFNSTI